MENMPSHASVVPQHVLEVLHTFAKSSILEETLEILIQSSKTASGRGNLAINKILPVVLELTQSLIGSSNHDLLFLSIKLLRNLCGGEISNQNSFINEKGVDIILRVFGSLSYDSKSDYEIIHIGLQLLGNVSLAGKEHQKAIWAQLFPVVFADMAKLRRMEICDTLCMILYTCCGGSLARVLDLCGDQGLQIVAELVRTASTAGFKEDWLKLLLEKVCFQQSGFPPLFSELSSVSDVSDNGKGTDKPFTTETAFLLGVLSESLSENIDELVVQNEFAHCVLGILRRVLGVVDFFSRGTSGLPTGSPTVDVLGYSLCILRDTCAQDGTRNLNTEDSGNTTDSLLMSGLVDLMLVLLRDLEPPSTIRGSSPQGEDQVPSASLKVGPYKGFRRDIVAIIANCLFRRRHVQDEIRRQGCIHLLMQQCVTDEDDPFLREWGIWSMRNLLEGNEENQRRVAELELQGPVDAPELAGLGLRVEVDKQTGRAKLVNFTQC